MKRLLLIALAVLVCANAAMAQGGVIGLYADPAATECNIYDYPGIVQIHVVHQYFPAGVTSAQFMVNPADGANMIYLNDVVPYLHIGFGNSQTGITVSYLGCMTTPILVLTIQYFGQGISPSCSRYEVLPDPAAIPPGEVWITDCASPANQLPATGGFIYVNPYPPQCSCTVPVKVTTWSSLKALYQ